MDREDKLIYSLQESQDTATVEHVWDSEEQLKDDRIQSRIHEVTKVLGPPGRKFRKIGCGDTIFERYTDVYYDEVNDAIMLTYGANGISNQVRITPFETFRAGFVEVRQRTIWVDAPKVESVSDAYRNMVQNMYGTIGATTVSPNQTYTIAQPADQFQIVMHTAKLETSGE